MEFALILPVIMLMLLLTIDFGRALYGWVVLQNSARIAANFAGLNADGWKSNIALVKTRYGIEIKADLIAANCDSFANTGGTPPDPTFIDGPDQSASGGAADSAYDVGDLARVNLVCTFHPVTPIISAIIGNNFKLGATSEFRIRSGSVTGLANPTQIPPPATPTPTPAPTPPPTPTPVGATPTPTTACSLAVADFVGNVGSASPPPSGGSPLTVQFTDLSTSGASCPISAWLWNFDDGTTSNLPNPSHVFTRTNSGQSDQKFTIRLTVTNAAGQRTQTKNNYVAVSP